MMQIQINKNNTLPKTKKQDPCQVKQKILKLKKCLMPFFHCILR